MTTPPELVQLAADQYDLRMEALSAHIKMMVNTGAWVGEQAQIAMIIRDKLKTGIGDARLSVQTIKHLTARK